LTGSRTNRGKQAKEVDITVKFKNAIFKSENSSKKNNINTPFFDQAGICFLFVEYSSSGMIYMPDLVHELSCGIGIIQGGARNGYIKSFSKI
jgi:hypothetical protein